MQMEIRRTFQMGNTLTEIHGRTADYTMYLISLFQEELTQITAILTRNACY